MHSRPHEQLTRANNPAPHSARSKDYHYLEQLVNNYQSVGLIDIAADEIYQVVQGRTRAKDAKIGTDIRYNTP